MVIRLARTISLGGSLFWTLFGLCLLLAPVAALAQTANVPKRVVILHWDDKDFPGNIKFDESFKAKLASSGENIEFYPEYVETSRFPGQEQSFLHDYLKRKYADRRVDAVVATADVPLNFLLQYRTDLFSDAPIVFVANNPPRAEQLSAGPGITGMVHRSSYRQTVDLALRLHPDTNQLFIISGTPERDKRFEIVARQELAAMENRVKMTYLTDLPLEELVARTGSLPRGSIALFVWQQATDERGRLLETYEVSARISATANVPIYALASHHLGQGVVGGYLLGPENNGGKVLEIVLRILSGTRAKDIPISNAPTVPMFDWRQLKRWGIREGSLPPGSIVQFKEVTLWDQYKWGLLALIAAILLEAALIARLLFTQDKLRQAERKAAKTHVRLREIVSSVPGMVWETVIDPKTRERKTTFVSDYVRRMLGYTPEEWLAQPPGFGLRLMADEDRESMQAASEAAIAKGEDAVSEHRWRAKDGRLVWIESHLSPILTTNGVAKGLRGVSLDITERKLAEETVNRTEEKSRALLEAIPDLMFLQTADGVYLDYHAPNENGLYLPPNKFLGKNMRDTLPPELAEMFAEYFKRAIETGETQIVEYAVTIPDGPHWYEARLVSTDGNILSIVRDITERKRALDELRQSEQRFGKVFQANPQPMSLTTIDDGLYLDVNESFLELSGYTRGEVIGHTALELKVWETPAVRKEFIQKLRRHGSVVNQEMRFRTKNGSFRTFLSSAERLDLGGEECLLVASSDITERVAAQQALTESEGRFRNMADTAPVLIWMSNTENRCIYVNQQWLDFTGRTIEQELGAGWTDGIYTDDQERCIRTYAEAFEGREPFQLEYRLRRFDGQYRWVIDTGTPRLSSTGKFLGYIGSCVDITDRKESEIAVASAHKELVIAHDEVQRLKAQLEEENIYLQEEIRQAKNLGEMVGESDAIKYVMFKVSHVAVTDSTVLITGETGTGKELVARAIHSASARSDRPLITVNCAALPATLIESELFGHEKGAFTGAAARKPGRFEIADGGTIFLDEVGELPLESQVKLLRVIQEGEIQRLGGSNPIKVDVRIIAATNRNLKREIERGAFREDLWYRLNVFPITVPPLRQRTEDIPLLVDHFVANFANKFGKTITSISPQTMQKLVEHSWPGNVRELANVIERAVIYTQGSVLSLVDVFEQTKDQVPSSPTMKSLEEVEREYIVHILEHTSWRIEGPQGAAKLLGMNPSTLRTRMIKLGIHKNSKANNH